MFAPKQGNRDQPAAGSGALTGTDMAAKPAVIVVGADKGGVGKTTVSRTLLDYFSANNVPTRAFDTESPRGTLKRFHPDITEIVDMTATADQMKIFDTLNAAAPSVTVIDVRAGLLSPGAGLAARHRLPRRRQGRPDHLRRVPYPRPLDRLAGRDRRDRGLHDRAPSISWSRTSSTTPSSSSGTRRPTIPISTASRTPPTSPSRSSTKWPMSRSRSLRSRS